MIHYYSISEIDEPRTHIIVRSKIPTEFNEEHYVLNWSIECEIYDKELLHTLNEQIDYEFSDYVLEHVYDDNIKNNFKMLKYSKRIGDYKDMCKILKKYVVKSED